MSFSCFLLRALVTLEDGSSGHAMLVSDGAAPFLGGAALFLERNPLTLPFPCTGTGGMSTCT